MNSKSRNLVCIINTGKSYFQLLRIFESLQFEFNFDIISDKLQNFQNRKEYTKIIFCIYGENDEEFSTIYDEYLTCQDNLRLDLNKIILSTSSCDLPAWKSKFYAENYILDLSCIDKCSKDIKMILEDSFKGTPKIKSPKLPRKYSNMEQHLEEIYKLNK